MTFTVEGGARGEWSVTLTGELDALTVESLRPALNQLLAAQPRCVSIDLAALRLVDSIGLGALVHFCKALHAQGGIATLRKVNDQPLILIRLLQFDRLMSLHGMSDPST